MRLNPNPRLEKLKDFRRQSDVVCHVYEANSGIRSYFNNRRERTLRQQWRLACWDIEADHITRFSHRHSALWDLY